MAKGGKQPGAGRPKGAINKNSMTVAEYLKAIGFDVLGALVKSAQSSDETVALRAQCELASFLYPKLRSVEVKAQVSTVTTQREIESASDRDLIATLVALEQNSDDSHTDMH